MLLKNNKITSKRDVRGQKQQKTSSIETDIILNHNIQLGLSRGVTLHDDINNMYASQKHKYGMHI